MVPETISLKDVLVWMDSGAPFSIAFVTHDEKRETGGEWIEMKEAFKHDYVSKEERARMDKAQPKAGPIRHPHHFENSTRNISCNGNIRKVHIRLIRRFNDKTVM